MVKQRKDYEMLQIIHHLEDRQEDLGIHHEKEGHTDQGLDQGNGEEAGKDHLAMIGIEDTDLQTDVGLAQGNDGETDHEREDEVAQEKGNTVSAANHPDTNMIKYYSNLIHIVIYGLYTCNLISF